jgi:hypothetical protein
MVVSEAVLPENPGEARSQAGVSQGRRMNLNVDPSHKGQSNNGDMAALLALKTLYRTLEDPDPPALYASYSRPSAACANMLSSQAGQ